MSVKGARGLPLLLALRLCAEDELPDDAFSSRFARGDTAVSPVRSSADLSQFSISDRQWRR